MRPIRIEFFRNERGEARVRPLPHLEVLDHHRDGVVRRNLDEASRVDCLHARGAHDRRGARSLGAHIESDHESNTQAAAYAQEIPPRDAVPCNAIENVHIRP